jgi:hypothetical protein
VPIIVLLCQFILNRDHNMSPRNNSLVKRLNVNASLALLAFLFATSASAQIVSMIGVGNHSCGQYSQYTNREQAKEYRQMYQQWAWGFMSGHNWVSRDQQTRTADDATVAAFLDNYCRRNPLSTVGAGVAALVAETGGRPVEFQYQK